MKLARSALALLVLPALASVAVADVEVPLVDSLGNDSGWTAYLTDDFNSDLTVVAVTDTFVSIEISHNYLTPPVDGHFGGCLVLFEQRLDDADTLSTIEIIDEVLYNGTGEAWGGYHWHINGCGAAFDRAETDSSGFDVTPFAGVSWGPAPCGWDDDHSGRLDVFAGQAEPDVTFLPGIYAGELVVDVDLGQADSDFGLFQNPIPEPGALSLAALGSVGMLLLRRRR